MPLLEVKPVIAPYRGSANHQFTGGFDYADMEKKLNENYKMWLEEYESDGKFTKENNYGLDELDMRGGKYEKTR